MIHGGSKRLIAIASLLAASVSGVVFARRAHANAVAGCSDWKYYAKRACLSIDDSSGAVTLTASVQVGRGGRGWRGYVELIGPQGLLARSDVQTLGAPASRSVDATLTGAQATPGEYCAIDWRWDVYHSDFWIEGEYCITR
jgi:hypothetical protein